MKKSIFLRVFCLVLALLAASAVVIGCAEKPAEGTETKGPKETEAETVDPNTVADLPDMNLEGYLYSVLHWYVNGWENRMNIDIYAEAPNADPINDAVYNRNTRLTEKYNFEIDYTTLAHNEVVNAMRQGVNTGDDLYDLVYARLTDVAGVVTEGDCLDFETAFEYVDLDKAYWDQSMRKELSFANHSFLMASSYNIIDEDATAALAFNKTIARDNNIPDVYGLASTGAWTFDALEDIMLGFESDINGDGVLKEADDVFAFLGGKDVSPSFYFGGGGRLTEKDDDDLPEYVFNTEENYDIFTRVCDIMYEPNFLNHHTISNTDDNYYRQLFIDGHGLFFWMRMDDPRIMRGEEAIDFGILPIPKYEEEQDNYYSMVSRHTTGFMSVLICEQNPDIVGFIMEAMAAASYKDLTSAYYDVTLKGKSARDDESQDMLDIIFAHRVLDIGDMLDFGGFTSTLLGYQSENRGKYDISSKYAAAESKIESDIWDFIEKVESL
ncbi:MAG: hypothetical protein MJ070_08920 [Lachnospiraceae bacterium]|nr:hypothetical protein [Lachnospiraceae bacterium]